MADVVKNTSEVVSSSSTKKKTKVRQQESHEQRQELVQQSSVTSTSSTSSKSTLVKQQSQQSSSSVMSASTMSSSGTVQMKQKQVSAAISVTGQFSSSGGDGVQQQISTSTSSSTKQEKVKMMNGATGEVVSSSEQKQVSNSSTSSFDGQNNQLQPMQFNEDDEEDQQDMKVTLNVTGGPISVRHESETDLYFANIVKTDDVTNTTNIIISGDDMPSSIYDDLSSSEVVVTVDNNNLVQFDTDSSSPVETPLRRHSTIIPTISIHPDLISDLEPPHLVPCLNSPDNSSTSCKSSDGGDNSMGHVDIDETDRAYHHNNNNNKSSIEIMGSDLLADVNFSGNSGKDVSDEDEDEEYDSEVDINNARKKKKKVKKTESFSVIELLDEKMRNLATKYKVPTTSTTTPMPELRACEKRVFENVSVANLRRSFCDLTAPDNQEFTNYHVAVVERPKSSFSKFESAAAGAGDGAGNRAAAGSAANEDGQERVDNNNKNAGTKSCKGCGEKVFVMEMIKAEKAAWHKNCFRCSECKKALSVDTYESNAGLLYCKPHFKELFQPKAVFESPEDSIAKRMKKRPELIIRENEPVELPPDVVRASIQPATADLEDLSVDVKSKFEMFEHFKESEKQEKREPVIVKRSTSVLAKLAKYQGGTDGVGIPDSELNGEVPEVMSDEDDEDGGHITARIRPTDEINFKLDDVKSKWENGMNCKKEEIHKHRQEEMTKFRTRLCLGKNLQLKEMYEKAVESSENDVKRTSELEELDLSGKKNIKEMFEKGIVNRGSDEEEDENEGRTSTVEMDRDVFEHGVIKNSRNLFQTLDRQASVTNIAQTTLNGAPKKIALRSPSGIIGVNDQNRTIDAEVVRSSDVIQDQFRAEDVGNKFKFFETYQEQKEQAQQKKAFRITPPREGQVKMESPEREVYRDPNVVRSGEANEDVVVSKTASKMLSVFKKLEETAATTEPVELQRPQRRPLKQFTPPRESRPEPRDSEEEEEEEEEEYESDEDDQQYQNGANETDQFLKEVGSLARAKNLRAKFEKWETEENARNNVNDKAVPAFPDPELIEGGNIESTRSIRARFEQPQSFDQPKLEKRQVQVKRFVELQNNGLNMEECVICNKRVYVMEKTEAMGKVYHKNCFRCSQCKCVLRMGNFTQNQGVLFCTPHFKQLFKIKGNYDEGFGHETAKQIFMKKQQAKLAGEGGDAKEN